MHQEVGLIATVAVSFVFAAILGYGADRLRLPPLVGYLVAGIMMGPFTPGFVADTALAGQLAEMGIILLMFGVGLHFSASDLLAVRGIAVPGAIGRIFFATLLGIGLCKLWGWSLGAGIVFGLSLSVASTVVLLKALEERNLVNAASGRVAVGWLIVEDLAMVLALVLLPALAELLGGHAVDTTNHGLGELPLALTIGLTLLKVAAFAAMAIFLGPRIVPWLLTMIARTGSRELFTLTVLAIALGIAFGSAAIFGVSFALGAFFAGVVMSESQLSHRAAADSLPLQNAFSVLFFVSVGMLFDPSILVRQPLAVMGALALIILGKAIITFAIVMLLRYPISMGLTLAGGLAQIGEFSFILAGLGVSLGLLPHEGQDMILAAAILSITLNPIVIVASDGLKKYMHSKWPLLFENYGRKNQKTLGKELEKIRALGEERQRQHQLKMQQLIETFPLFSQVGEDAQEELLLLFKARSAPPGERVIRRGDRGDSMYFISSGAVEVRVASGAIRLEPGAFFGEMALLSGGRRTADVIAVDFCQFEVLERRDFNMFMSHHPNLRAIVSEMAQKRTEMNVLRQQWEKSMDLS
ncbi:cation:proton antiporter domain-containing protein [Rhizobium binae]|uniref:cation:proton antiporter domain-containing protein n=1 Tax=Rhizobium binae TaxID=1138190 RepID=UPI001C832827|nr:cation:proton antiporter [Rhizobium binae]MBX4927471.1 cyclic nucleotide-binding domain-containing protein [Rhizobium binae]MBX4938816.1 cyclic nucleotide-binding domain-containing protein [Rhizobium binae]MBX4944657.1 cyclic nucleotide-binding domain-containing protein [Rhizobium binae]MBX4950955.1 cyclic nucleotide-binding domain-containing protein [Rhizobium binae]MBX4963711.1 cyclic nucleotide-binding domain-containing protein [Rhizobium binae]